MRAVRFDCRVVVDRRTVVVRIYWEKWARETARHERKWTERKGETITSIAHTYTFIQFLRYECIYSSSEQHTKPRKNSPRTAVHSLRCPSRWCCGVWCWLYTVLGKERKSDKVYACARKRKKEPMVPAFSTLRLLKNYQIFGNVARALALNARNIFMLIFF